MESVPEMRRLASSAAPLREVGQSYICTAGWWGRVQAFTIGSETSPSLFVPRTGGAGTCAPPRADSSRPPVQQNGPCIRLRYQRNSDWYMYQVPMTIASASLSYCFFFKLSLFPLPPFGNTSMPTDPRGARHTQVCNQPERCVQH